MKHETQWPRFWARVTMTQADGCWLWTGTLDKNGYGKYCHQRAHRLSYFQLVGPIPEGMYLDHLCRNHQCVNPDHLRCVTPRQNALENNVGPTAKKAAATHCKKGHLLSGDNLYVRPNTGHRLCRTCLRENALAHYYRNHEALKMRSREYQRRKGDR